MFCMHCGAELSPEAKFCGTCGGQVPVREAAPVQNEVRNQAVNRINEAAPVQNEMRNRAIDRINEDTERNTMNMEAAKNDKSVWPTLSVRVKRDPMIPWYSRIIMIIDGEEEWKLAPQKEPDEFQLEPFVEHTIEFYDPNATRKGFTKGIGGAIVGGMFGGLTGGGVLGAIDDAIFGAVIGSGTVKASENGLILTLNPMDRFPIVVQATKNGAVKIESDKKS